MAKASCGAVINRLEHIYSEIYIDEVQDLTGYDLAVLDALFASKIDVRLVGDVRQSTFNTNPQDPRNKQYRDLNMLNWFAKHETAGILTVEHSSKTWRSNQQIATFSDTIFPAACGFPPTELLQTASSDHDGVFVVSPDHVDAYIKAYRPLCLRQAKSTPLPDHIDATNFGVAKGITCDRVLIFPTGPIRDFINKSRLLTGKSACGLYVGVTRAIHSVAFVLDRYRGETLGIWLPPH